MIKIGTSSYAENCINLLTVKKKNVVWLKNEKYTKSMYDTTIKTVEDIY